ncbi:MAG: hypothetical protein AB1324_06530 [Candidatus Micrarchaeota archaeon]
MGYEGGEPVKKTLVQRAVPKPVRKAFRWMNFHFSEEGRLINKMAKTLPEEKRDAVVEQGKDMMTARSKKNFPKGARNVAASLVVGQGMWYFVCPYLYNNFEAVRESPAGWLVSGGLDKLFINADEHLFQTGGYSHGVAANAARAASGSVALGAAALTLELATDFSRCFIEYWTQKKYGIVADGAARAYGQVRTFPVRYSSLEAYQKMISYALRPWTIGTYNQVYSSVYGILGSIWRTGPQLAVVLTVGRAVDKLLHKISEWTGIGKIAKRIHDGAEAREKRALEAIRELAGEVKFTALRLQLAAESKTFWKWNPFRPALRLSDAERAAEAISDYREAASSPDPLGTTELRLAHITKIGECAGRLESVFGTKKLGRVAPSFGAFAELMDSPEVRAAEEGTIPKIRESFEAVLTELEGERKLT